MKRVYADNVGRLVAGCLGATAASRLLATLEIDARIDRATAYVTRSEMAMSLSIVLFDGVLNRVPSAARYCRQAMAEDRLICLDHGALGTASFADRCADEHPEASAAFSRLFEPLGYLRAETRFVPDRGVTAHLWRHAEFPDTLPQFVVNELNVQCFSPAFQHAAGRVFGVNRAPLRPLVEEALASLQKRGEVVFSVAAAALPLLNDLFGRHHGPSTLDDFLALSAESPEAAWLATDGNALKHLAARVDEVTLSSWLQHDDPAMHGCVRVLSGGRVRQAGLSAARVERRFLGCDKLIKLTTDGSFFELVSRATNIATGELDLALGDDIAQPACRAREAA